MLVSKSDVMGPEHIRFKASHGIDFVEFAGPAEVGAPGYVDKLSRDPQEVTHSFPLPQLYPTLYLVHQQP